MRSNSGKVYKVLIAQTCAIARKSAKTTASIERRISKIKNGKGGSKGNNGKGGANDKRGPRGLPGKIGKNRKDSTSLDKSCISAQTAKSAKQLDQNIAAMTMSARAGNAQARKRIASVSVKLGNQIQSAATSLNSKIKAVKAANNKLKKQIATVRKMKGPRGAPGNNGKRGAREARGRPAGTARTAPVAFQQK